MKLSGVVCNTLCSNELECWWSGVKAQAPAKVEHEVQAVPRMPVLHFPVLQLQLHAGHRVCLTTTTSAYLLFVRREGPTWHPLPPVACELPGGIFSSSRAALAVPPQPRSCQQMGLIHKLGFYQKEWSKSPLHPQRTMRITVELSKLGDTFASPDLFALLSNHIKATPYKHVWLSASKTRELKRSHWWRDQKIMLIKSLLCVILTHHTCLPQLSFNLCRSINIHQSPQWSPCLPSLAVSTAASQV